MLRPPGEDGDGRRVGVEEEVGADLPAEARDGRGVEGDAVGKGPLYLVGHDRNVFLPAVDVAEGKADELDVLLPDILHNLSR